ncbi:MAG TPA: hypothetical protein VM619_02550 [Luteimonas sp.]|nr:hypothetical protein [Luteimonas sp.]
MDRERSPLDKALGKLVSSIQREELEAAGSEAWEQTKAALEAVENLLWSLRRLPGSSPDLNIAALIGESWLARHPSVLPALEQAQAALDSVTSNNSFKPNPLRGSA